MITNLIYFGRVIMKNKIVFGSKTGNFVPLEEHKVNGKYIAFKYAKTENKKFGVSLQLGEQNYGKGEKEIGRAIIPEDGMFYLKKIACHDSNPYNLSYFKANINGQILRVGEKPTDEVSKAIEFKPNMDKGIAVKLSGVNFNESHGHINALQFDVLDKDKISFKFGTWCDSSHSSFDIKIPQALKFVIVRGNCINNLSSDHSSYSKSTSDYIVNISTEKNEDEKNEFASIHIESREVTTTSYIMHWGKETLSSWTAPRLTNFTGQGDGYEVVSNKDYSFSEYPSVELDISLNTPIKLAGIYGEVTALDFETV